MIKIYEELDQGSDAWFAARCGLLTASEMKLVITPTGKVAVNDKATAHLHEIVAQRITKYVEPHYIGDDQMRGWEDEIRAREKYIEHYAPVKEVGFITNDKWGFTLGYSPDGLVGNEGLIECKSRRQKFQIESIVKDAMPDEYYIQVQTGLLVTERLWCDFISYSAGLPMMVKRVWSDGEMQNQIIEAAAIFESKAKDMIKEYKKLCKKYKYLPTEREVEQEIEI